MSYECIVTDVHGEGSLKAGVIRLNRPKQMNALNDTLMDELGDALLRVRERTYGGVDRGDLLERPAGAALHVRGERAVVGGAQHERAHGGVGRRLRDDEARQGGVGGGAGSGCARR